MEGPTPETLRLRALIDAHREELNAVLVKYHATNPRLFGSVARGDAQPGSDIDILVDFLPVPDTEPTYIPRSQLYRAGGLFEEFREILDHSVDVFSLRLLKRRVSESAIGEAIAL